MAFCVYKDFEKLRFIS